MKEKTALKNNTIEFYRFLAILIIAIFHFDIQYSGEFHYFKGGYLGVEFFFILTGMFIAVTCDKETNKSKTAYKIVLSKVKRLYPSYIIMMILFIIFDIFIRKYIRTIPDFLLRLGDEIWELLFLQNIGIPGMFSFEGTLWFITSMLMSSYIISYLLLKNRHIYVHFILPVSCVLGYSIIGKKFGTLSMQDEWIGGIYGGLFRGFLAMNVGVVTYYLNDIIKRFSKYIISITEVVLLIYIGWILKQGFCIEDFKVLILFPLLISCAMSNKGIVSKLLNNNISGYLGKISYELYLDHLLVSTIITMFWPGNALMIIPFLVISLILAILVHILSENALLMLKNDCLIKVKADVIK